MNRYEQEKAGSLPFEFRPLGAWAYFGYSLLFSLPIIGFIALIICACSGSNINRRSFARSYFCGYIVAAIAIVLLIVCFGSFFAELIGQLKSMLGM